MRRELLSGGRTSLFSFSLLFISRRLRKWTARARGKEEKVTLEPRMIIISLVIRSLTSPRKQTDLTFRVFFIVFWMSPLRIRDIQLKSKHLDSEGGKTSSRVKGLREKRKSCDDYRGKLLTSSSRTEEITFLNKQPFIKIRIFIFLNVSK